MASLVLKNVKKSYGEKTVIHGVDLEIEKGEFIVFVGPSGCGKSTILRMIAGLEQVTSGEILLDDKIINKLPPKDRNIAMVFQNYALYPHMSVYNNMAYGLRMHGIDKREIDKRVKEAAEVLELSDYLRRKPHELSGGQRQRVAMGRAIVRRPSVYLFDEPLSNLDTKLRMQMRLEIKRLHKKFNITSMYVTHDQMEAMTLADRVVVINQGQVEQIGTPIEIYRHPATIFVGGFMGSPAMNFLSARVNHDLSTIIIDNEIILPLNFSIPERYKNSEVVLGIRPENLVEASGREPLSFKLSIDMTDALGSDILVHGTIGKTRQNITARLPGKWEPNHNNEVNLSVTPGSLHLFDKQTTKLIGNDPTYDAHQLSLI